MVIDGKYELFQRPWVESEYPSIMLVCYYKHGDSHIRDFTWFSSQFPACWI